jgi:hypothetical protein
MTTTIALAQLAKADTDALIAQYDAAISTPGRRYAANGRTPLQRRINTIVDLLSERADDDDAVALAWYAKTED